MAENITDYGGKLTHKLPVHGYKYQLVQAEIPSML